MYNGQGVIGLLLVLVLMGMDYIIILNALDSQRMSKYGFNKHGMGLEYR